MVLRRILIACLFVGAWNVGLALAQKQESTPLVHLKKGDVQLWLSTPGDAVNYRGTRFDHSGMIQKIQVSDHQLCERWHTGTPNPDANDDVTGPCEEFGNSKPLGYLPNRPGSHFLKIGVGVLKQPDEKEYRFWEKYEIVQPGTWTTHRDSSSIAYRQQLFADPENKAVGYAYEKRVRVTETGFRIEHSLKNIGTQPWKTDHYNHNFFLVDSDKVGPNYELQVPFPIEAIQRKANFDETAIVTGKTIRFRELVGSRSFFAELSGHKNQVADHQFQLRHAPSGVTIACQGDSPLSKMNFWGMGSTICPEPYTQIQLRPDETFEWNLAYTVSIDAKR